MIYDGTLTMPANFAVLDEEEMTYVDGGWIGYNTFSSGFSARDSCNFCASDLWKVAACAAIGAGWVAYYSGAVGAAVGSVVPGGGTSVGAILGVVFGGLAVGVIEYVVINWALEWGHAANAAERRGWQITTVEVALNSLVMEVRVY